jgi:hypothetical protein
MRAPTGADMIRNLREKYADPNRVKLLRCPNGNFIEVTHDQYIKLVDEFEKLILYAELGQKPSELEKIGIQMLLGWDYDFYAKAP